MKHNKCYAFSSVPNGRQALYGEMRQTNLIPGGWDP